MFSEDPIIRERQSELLDMIKLVDSEFKKEGITYSIADGTLLGAIRHNGFIPWDDDIDIIVDRENADKIVASAPKFSKIILRRYLWIQRLQRVEDKNEEGLMLPTIDIFIADSIPDKNITQQLKVFSLKVLQGMMKKEPEYQSHSLFYKICLFITHYVGKLFSDEALYKVYDKLSRSGCSEKSEFVCFYNSLFSYLNVKYKKNIFNKFENHIFEDCKLPITSEYDYYLTVTYGDYMTPPKESEQKSIHIQ